MRRHEHLLSGLPNWRLMRALIRLANWQARRSDSRYKLVMRFRKPRRGIKGYDGLKCEDGRRISVYIRLTAGAEREDRERRRRDSQTQHNWEERRINAEVERRLRDLLQHARPASQQRAN